MYMFVYMYIICIYLSFYLQARFTLPLSRNRNGRTLSPKPGTQNPHLVEPDLGRRFQVSEFRGQGDDFVPPIPEPPDTCAMYHLTANAQTNP